jgi:Domain of unknown function (DUF5680)
MSEALWSIEELQAFIVQAKLACYVGSGAPTNPSRMDSHDLEFSLGDWGYRDSYFGGTDFLGQETVWHCDVAVWAMNYYGRVVRTELIDGERAGQTIKAALSSLYTEGRFLGGFEWTGPHGRYVDTSRGDVTSFHGRECIIVNTIEAYVLDYFGGLIKP